MLLHAAYILFITILYRYIAAGLLVLGFGSLLFSLPHFLSEKITGKFNDNGNGVLCNMKNDTGIPAVAIHSSMSNYFYVFILGQILHGIGAAPILSLGKLTVMINLVYSSLLLLITII